MIIPESEQHVCPYCGSQAIIAKSMDPGLFSRDCECYSCGGTWEEHFTIYEIEIPEELERAYNARTSLLELQRLMADDSRKEET